MDHKENGDTHSQIRQVRSLIVSLIAKIRSKFIDPKLDNDPEEFERMATSTKGNLFNVLDKLISQFQKIILLEDRLGVEEKKPKISKDDKSIILRFINRKKDR